MFDLDHWQEIRNALASNKLRTALTAFGVFWGIFMLLILLASGNGLENGVSAGFSGTATNSFFLWSQRTGKPYRGLPSGRNLQLTNDDVAAVREQVPEAAVVAPRNQLGGFRSGATVRRGDKSSAFSVMGDHPEIAAIQSYRLDAGRFLNKLDVAERRKVAVIGTRVLEVMFAQGEDPVGQSIEINGVYFKVIGVFRTVQLGNNAERDAQTIFVPFSTFQSAFNYGNRVGWLAVTSRPDSPASVVQEKTLQLLKARHQVAPDDNRAFGSFNLEDEYNKIQGLFGGIRLLVWVVGIGTLAAGAIGVSNIMLIIVKERTREIGIRRAVGARPASIVRQILLEAVILTAAAGWIGLVAGVGLAELVASLTASAASATGPTMFRDPGVQLEDALQALVILIGAGALAGIVPAQRAISVNPVVALRSE